MRDGKLGIGIVGCNAIANNKHMPALAKLADKCEMVAFCDLADERAKSALAEYGAPGAKTFADYRQLLQDPQVDVVYVLTPNVSHCPITVEAFEAGKHVMCEKPMAPTAAEAQKMVDAWKKSGKKFTISYQNRFRSEVTALYKARRDLGEIYFAKAHAIRRRGIPTWGVFTDKAKQGGGPLIDIGTHSLDLALWMMDNYKPRQVMGQTFCKLGNTLRGDDQGTEMQWDPDSYEVEDSAFGMVKMADGAVIYLEASWALNITDEKEASVTLCGTNGGAELRRNGIPGSADLVLNSTKYGRQLESLSKADSEILFSLGDHASPEDLEAAQWIDAILGDTDPLVMPLQALVVTQILDAIYESARLGQMVTL